jgi:alkylation response protein AidB-like acyl-CoA dehydrogenase
VEPLTDVQAAILDSLSRVIEKEIAPIAQQIDEEERFPVQLIGIFGELGLMQARVPEEYGGPGLDLTTTCMAKEAVARVSMTGAQLIHQNTISFVLPLLHFGTEEQRRRWLPLVARGGVVSSVAITEPPPARTWARCARAPCATATTTSSTARSASSRWRRWPATSRCSPRPAAAAGAAWTTSVASSST